MILPLPSLMTSFFSMLLVEHKFLAELVNAIRECGF
jgi:hypothetical protein